VSDFEWDEEPQDSRASKARKLDAERAARDARSAAIDKEINESYGTPGYFRDPNDHENRMINSSLEGFRREKPGPKKEAHRTTFWNIVQGTGRGRTQATRGAFPQGSAAPCANPGCNNEVGYDEGDVTCGPNGCDMPNSVDVQREKE
jgi:hypothetical protein